MTGGQLVQLVARRPELAAFVRRRGDAITAFNPRDRCWFLDDGGLCRVEIEDGRAAKPASCRLFPFNRVFRVGEVMVVDFNSVICPLEVAADGTGVAHADVIAEIESIRDPAIVGTTLPGDGTVIEREREIAERIFAGDPAAAQGVELAAPDGFELVAGAPWRAPSAMAAAIAVTPSLRFNELYGPRKIKPDVLGRMWLAWLGFAAMGETLAQRSLGMQELTTVWSEQAPLMHVIARWRDVPVLKPGPIELPPEPLVTALAQTFVDNKKPRRTLGELVTSVFGERDTVARVTSLKMADAIVRSALS